METITSLQNPKVKSAIKLANRRERRSQELMTLEGIAELTLALEGNLEPVQLFFCPLFAKATDQGLLSVVKNRGAAILFCNEAVLQKLAYREHPDGWFLVARQPRMTLQNLELRLQESKEPPFLLMAEDLEKPGNLGAILRTAEGVGVHGVFSLDGRTDIYNPNVVRSSKGTLFTLPVVESTNEEVWEWIESRGITVHAAIPEDGVSYWEKDYRGPTAFVLGAENEGLSSFWKTRAHDRVYIPMVGRVNSLNVAMSAGLLAYEVRRQRSLFL